MAAVDFVAARVRILSDHSGHSEVSSIAGDNHIQRAWRY